MKEACVGADRAAAVADEPASPWIDFIAVSSSGREENSLDDDDFLWSVWRRESLLIIGKLLCR